jgi:hypothetical protein
MEKKAEVKAGLIYACAQEKPERMTEINGPGVAP